MLISDIDIIIIYKNILFEIIYNNKPIFTKIYLKKNKPKITKKTTPDKGGGRRA